MAGSVADALKQIPADMIKSIEVITSPSARYDSEGSSGIINIITKKNTLEGMTLGVDVRAGNRGANLGLNGNLRTGNMGFSLRGYGRAEYGIKGAFENVQTTQTSIGLQKVFRVRQRYLIDFMAVIIWAGIGILLKNPTFLQG